MDDSPLRTRPAAETRQLPPAADAPDLTSVCPRPGNCMRPLHNACHGVDKTVRKSTVLPKCKTCGKPTPVVAVISASKVDFVDQSLVTVVKDWSFRTRDSYPFHWSVKQMPYPRQTPYQRLSRRSAATKSSMGARPVTGSAGRGPMVRKCEQEAKARTA